MSTIHSAKYIAEHLSEFGLIAGIGPSSGRLTKGGDLVLLRKDAPRLVLAATDEGISAFVASFGAPLLAKLVNGTSLDVGCERIARDTLIADRSVTNATLLEKMISSLLLGVVVRGPVTQRVVYVAADGTEHTSKDAASAADKAAQIERANAFRAMCADNGVPADVALALAKAQFPLAFAD